MIRQKRKSSSAKARSKKEPPSWRWFALGLVAVMALVATGVWIGRTRSGGDRPQPSANSPPQPAQFKTVNDQETFATYAGSESCRDCHAQAYSHWTNSHHALAERSVDANLDRAAFEPPRSIRHGSQNSEARTRDGHFELVTAGLEVGTTAFTPARVLGVDPLRQFLFPARGGRWQVGELSFDPRKAEWFDVYGDEDRRPGEWGHWTGRGMTWNSMCASCHNTRLRKNYSPATDSYATGMAERGVGCEACHGPLGAHMAWQRQHRGSTTNDPTAPRLDKNQMLDTCGSCHARRGDLTGEFTPGENFFDHFALAIPDGSDLFHPDGQVREEDYEFTSFLSSRMYAAGVRCLDCHEPHSGKNLVPGDALCLRCHGPPVAPAPKIDPVSHTHHKADTSGSHCVDCHMPQTIYMQRHARRDHGFTIPDPLLTRQHNIPNACNRCHVSRSVDWSLAAVEKYYGPRMNRPTRTRARTIASARGGDSNAVPALLQLAHEEKVGLWRASATRLLGRWAAETAVKPALLERVGDADPLVRTEAAHSLEPLFESGDTAAAKSLRHLLNDPVRAVRVAAAGVLLRELDTNSPAGQDFMRELAFNLDQPVGALRFGGFLMERGDPASALPWLERAVSWDGNSPPFRQALAVCLSANGRAPEAVCEFEAACRLAPGDAGYRFQLALAFNEAGRLTDAVAALEQTVKLDQQHAQGWYNLGLGYSAQGRETEAIEALLRAETIEPASPRAPYARATIHVRLGQNAEARRAAERALAVQPNFREAAQLLRQLSAGTP